MNKPILDACCGSRMFYFQPESEEVLFQDIREETFTIHKKHKNVKPEVINDFRNMPYKDETFYLVIFDPPHLRWAGPNSIMKAQYGQLDKNWPDHLKKGFDECWRVLKENGTLIFKWSDAQINVKEVLKLFPVKPLLGNKRGNTHWMVFFKSTNMDMMSM